MRKGKGAKKATRRSAMPEERPEVQAVRERVRGLAELSPDDQPARLGELMDAVQSPSEDPDLAAALAEELGNIRSEAAIPLLRSLDQPDRPKAVVKAARRALHRLRSQGIAVEETPVQPGAAVPLIGGRRILRCVIGPVDSQGDQVLSLLFSTPLKGTEAVELVGSDIEGIKETDAASIRKREYDALINEDRERFRSLADAPADYVMFRAREFEAINRETGKALPMEYQIYRELFHMPGRQYERPIVYDEIDSEAVGSDPSLLEKVEELLDVPEFKFWLIPEERISSCASQLLEAEESQIVLSDAAKEERIERILQAAAEELFTPEWRARCRRRLEENAYILVKTDRAEQARIAVACALQLSPDGPPSSSIPFVREVIKRSIHLSIAIETQERRVHRVGG